MLFALEPVVVRGVPVVQVSGELDIATAPQLDEAVGAALAARPPLVVLDLSAATFLDSSGARTLALSGKRAAGEGSRLEVVCPQDNTVVRRVMGFLQLESVVPVRESLDEAVPA